MTVLNKAHMRMGLGLGWTGTWGPARTMLRPAVWDGVEGRTTTGTGFTTASFLGSGARK